jgi:Spy/CpxP family protein refolding chaperone
MATKMLVASAFAICLSLAAVPASAAMPLAPPSQAVDQAISSDTIRVAGGCGPGWHRGPYGGCRPMYNCPPGWHSGPFGRHCFRNW